MPAGIDTDLIDRIAPLARNLVTVKARALPRVRYADVRIDVSEGKSMQSKKLGNGGPTMRSRAILTGGQA